MKMCFANFRLRQLEQVRENEAIERAARLRIERPARMLKAIARAAISGRWHSC